MAKRPATTGRQPRTDHDESRGWKPEPGRTPPHVETHHHHGGRKVRTILEAVAVILELERLIMALSQTVTDALAAQDAKIVATDQKVDQFIATHQGTSAADDQAVVDRLTAQGQALDAIGVKLTPPA